MNRAVVSRRWRFFGVFVFGFFAFMELGDLLGMVSAGHYGQTSNPLSEVGQQVGIGTQIVAGLLALGIVLSGLAAAYALLRGLEWAWYAALITAFCFLAYGANQLASALLRQNLNPTGLFFSAAVYMLLGVVASWIGQKARPARLPAR